MPLPLQTLSAAWTNCLIALIVGTLATKLRWHMPFRRLQVMLPFYNTPLKILSVSGAD